MVKKLCALCLLAFGASTILAVEILTGHIPPVSYEKGGKRIGALTDIVNQVKERTMRATPLSSSHGLAH